MRVPLYLKLMASYMLVVGLVLFPAFFYVRQIQQSELHENRERELRDELTSLSARLEAIPAAEAPLVISHLNGLIPHRATLIDAEGYALADSVVTGTLENHADRPEVRAARESADGFGSATRKSATTGDEYLYTARRYPLNGPTRGVIRLAISTRVIREMEARAMTFMNRAGAAALSLAVVASFVAAIVLSRRLRRIADAARAFAQGDFGHALDVTTGDEIGDVARALDNLAGQLRSRLVAAGADRATLQGLLDELPVGVILFATEAAPALVSGRARELCGMSPTEEEEQTRLLLEHATTAGIVKALVDDGRATDDVFALPWRPERRLRLRWMPVFDAEGKRRPAVAISGGAPLDEEIASSIERSAAAVRTALEGETDPARGRALLEAATTLDALVPLAPATPDSLEVVPFTSVYDTTRSRLAHALRACRLDVEIVGADPSLTVIDAAGRTARALTALMLAGAIGEPATGRVTLRAHPEKGHVRLRVPSSVSERTFMHLTEAIRDIGGDAGCAADGSASEAWIALPRA